MELSYTGVCIYNINIQVLTHSTRDGADGPAELVQVGPGPLCSIHLLGQLLGHDGLGV